MHKSKLQMLPMNNFHFESHIAGTPILAVLFDLDGTLLNTEQSIKGVLGEVLARYGKILDKENADKKLGITYKELAKAIVKDYELPITWDNFFEEIMPMFKEKWVRTKALPGANRLIKHLHKHGVPIAIASNATRKDIDAKISHQPGWSGYFSVILGSDQVKSGKPSPDIFLEAANKIGVDAVHCLVIEDSMTGVNAAKAAGMKVVAIPSLQNADDQYSIADCVFHSLLEFLPELWGLPPFEDWVDNALPVEPFNMNGWYSNGFLYHSADNEEFALFDQVCGLYFGWAKFDNHEIFKVVTNIGWEHDGSKRKIKIHMLDVSNNDITDQHVQIFLVGYIRGLSYEENGASDVEILEEDKMIARSALDLSEFGHHKNLLFSAEASFECGSAVTNDNK